MNAWSRVFRGETQIDFVGLRNRWFAFSGILIVLSLAGFLFRGGVNLGLEFEGGVLVQTPNPAAADVTAFRSALSDIGVEGRIQLIDDGASVRIQTGPLDADTQEQVVQTVDEIAGSVRNDTSLESVGPTFGALVARQAVIALSVFLGLAALFISWRLQWKMAAAGLVALVHDMILTVGVYAVTGFEVTPATVVALLTILGYSLYDTVVVFDKVEEFEETLAEETTYDRIVNRAMNQVLVRSLATSFTSLLPVGSLLFVGALILGAASLQDFALALFVGIAAGTYSSIFVAGPLLAMWKEREPVWIEHRERLERRAEVKEARASRGGGAKAPATKEAPAETKDEGGSTPPPRPPRGPKPRPPKGRR
jgi:preprotein translocase subunit SecF